MEPLIRYLHAAYAAPADGVTDAELLARCAAGKDDAAFELLVRRHAELVWRVCRSVARDHHAAEDAFQATFLALARGPSAVRDRSAAGWLARVAYHAALKARPRGESAPLSAEPASPAPEPTLAIERSEFAPLLHAELNRLPERYRVPVVLCHLHGFTQAEAARQLGLPVGTVATRVSRGLGRLRDRLTRRGVALSAAGVGGLLGASASAVPPGLVPAAVGAGSAVPEHIARLSQGALSAMKPVKWKLTAAAGLLAAAALGTAWAVAPAGPRPEPAAEKPAAAAGEKPAAARAPADYATRRQALDNAKKIALAIWNYHDEHGHYPDDIRGKDGKPLLSWRVALLPYMDHKYLYKQFKLDEPWDGEHNKKLLAELPDVYASSPAVMKRLKPGETYFQRVAGKGAILDPGKQVGVLDVTDGTSVTLLLLEGGTPVPWTKPADIPFDPNGKAPDLAGPYPDATHAALADGSMFRLNPKADPALLKLLVQRNDNTPLQLDKLAAPPAKAVTEEDKKLAESLRDGIRRRADRTAMLADCRFLLEQALRKHGPVPQPDPPADTPLEELDEISRRLGERDTGDFWEVERLTELLRKKDPKAAEQVEKETEKRRREWAEKLEGKR